MGFTGFRVPSVHTRREPRVRDRDRGGFVEAVGWASRKVLILRRGRPVHRVSMEAHEWTFCGGVFYPIRGGVCSSSQFG